MLSIHPLFSRYAVLQRQKPVPIWGKGMPGTNICVKLQGKIYQTMVREDGSWYFETEPLDASFSEEMTVSDGKETLRLRDLAVGEVWLAGGQSNMEFPMRNLREYKKLKQTVQPAIRLFGVPKVSYEGHLQEDDFSNYGFWRPCTPDNLWFYSAIPFYFSCSLLEKYHVPVGILNCSFGGTRASAWADPEFLKTSAAKLWVEEYERDTRNLNIEDYEKQFKSIKMFRTKSEDFAYFNNKNWRGYNRFEIIFWRPLSQLMMPKLPVVGPLDRNRPGACYNYMLKTLAPYGIRGVLWYQGEADDTHPEVYDAAMVAVIQSWRTLWNEDLPFLMMELAPFEGYGMFKAQNYVLLREKQEKVAVSVPGVYLTNVMDAGSAMDIHPKDKKVAAERLMLLALGKIYGEQVLCDAPEALTAAREGERVEVRFAHSGTGMIWGAGEENTLRLTVDGTAVKPRHLQAEGDRISIAAPEFWRAEKITISYGRENYCKCLLKNSAGIPAKPFAFTVYGRKTR